MDFLEDDSAVNSTLPTSDENEMHKKILNKVSNMSAIIALCILMLAMGTDISWKQIWAHLRRPKAIIIGILGQFVIMPLTGFALVQTVCSSPAHAISVLLMSCCPGGSISNVFTYFMDGDVPLSVTMTSLSTFFSLGLMPFNLWFYGMWIDTGELVIPYQSIATSLAYVIFPVCSGMIIRWKFPFIAVWITKAFSLIGFILIIICIMLQIVAHTNLFANIPPILCIASVVIPSTGFVLGYGLAWILRQPTSIRKTIALESTVQNVAIALAVISISPFEFDVQKSLLTFPIMYGISTISLCTLLCSSHQIFKKKCKRTDGDKVQGTTFGDPVKTEDDLQYIQLPTV